MEGTVEVEVTSNAMEGGVAGRGSYMLTEGGSYMVTQGCGGFGSSDGGAAITVRRF